MTDPPPVHLDPLAPATPAAPPPRARFRAVWLVAPALVAVAAAAGAVGALALRPPSLLPPETTVAVVAPSPDVVLAIQSLARLETTTFHMERVVDLSDEETRVYGLVHAKDAILLVAVGDVVAGVDLAKIDPKNVDADWESKRVTVTLPAPEVFSAHLDDKATHVFARHTDVLAARHEDLEGRARAEATRTMKQAAIDAGALDKARAGAEAPVRALLESSGFREVEIRFAD